LLPTQSQRIELDVASVWRDQTGVIHVRFNPGVPHGLAAAQQVVEAHVRLADGQTCVVLADIRNVSKGADRSARKYYVSEEGAYLKSAMAMVADSPIQRMIGNLFLQISRPPYPTRLFGNPQDALAWLNRFA